MSPSVSVDPSRAASEPWSDTYEFTIKIQLPGMEVHKCRPWPIRGPRKIITRQSINIFNSFSILMTNSAAADRFLSNLPQLQNHRPQQKHTSPSLRTTVQRASQPANHPLTRTQALVWLNLDWDFLGWLSCCRFLSIKQMFNKYGVRSWRKNQSPSSVDPSIDRSSDEPSSNPS